ncbi:MAG: DUF58 domain-containing protein [Planctomycetes bacterium]|nr:DUF58 domain-containing protein [Planctomycetota bacterium]
MADATGPIAATVATATAKPRARVADIDPVPVRGTSTWPLPLPTARAAAFIAAAAVPVVVATWWTPAVWIGAVMVLAVLVACLVDFFALPHPETIECLRLGSPVLPLGAGTDVSVAIRRREGVGPAARAAARTAIPFEFVDDLDVHIARVREPEGLVLPAAGHVVATTTVLPSRRGRMQLGAVHVRLRGPMGLAGQQVRFDVGRDVRVLPGVASVADAARLLRRGLRREAGLRQARRRGEGTSFESLREYVAGDDPRKLDWKASARHGKLIARQYELERSRTVLLLVDAGRWMTAEVGGLTRLDHVLNACVLLSHVAALRDDRVGMLAFAERILAYVPPVKGRMAVERIVDATLDVEPRLVESDYERAFAELAARHRKRSLVVLFTDVLSNDASRIVADEAKRQARRHVVLLVTLRDPALDALADCTPANASAAYEQAAAEDLLLEREQAIARMRRDGLHILDIDPRRLGPALVEKYLDLKARLLV